MVDIHATLFGPKSIGGRQAPNRFVANPVERNTGSVNGGVSDKAMAVYEELARGSWGVVIVESTAATSDRDCRGPGSQALMLNNNTVDSFKRLVERFKAIDPNALLIIQLGPGSFGMEQDLTEIPSDRIARAGTELVDAILLARQVGFDGVDCKQCHGSFPARLVARSNKRDDQWGGATVAERSRFISQIVTRVRGELASGQRDDFLFGTRVFEIDVGNLRDMVIFYEHHRSFDFINVSAVPFTQNAHALFALSQSVKMMEPTAPIIASGATDAVTATQSFDRVNDLMTGNLAPDFMGFGRQSIADPLMPIKLTEMKSDRLKWCRSCGGCTDLIVRGKPVVCVQ